MMRVCAGLFAEGFAKDGRGNVATLAALFFPVAIGLGAVAIDSGALYVERRELQALADMAAITAAANIDSPETAARTVLTDNGISSIVVAGTQTADEITYGLAASAVQMTVTTGRYAADPALAVDQRFQAGSQPYNAVRVSLRKQGTRYFASRLVASPMIGTTSIASASPEAAFSIGSRLASLNGGVLNALLSGLTGSTISLSVMDYNALLDADIELFGLLDALAGELHLVAGTYDDVLASNVKVGKVAAAMSKISGIDRTAVLALQSFAQSASGGSAASVKLERVFDLGSAGLSAIGHPPAGFGATVSALEVLSASAAVANGTHQVQLNLGASIPGLLGVRVDLAIGEPPQSSPWFALGEKGTVVRTAQTRLLVTATVGGPALLGALRLPIYIEIAYAEGQLTDIGCAGGGLSGLSATVDARPGIAEVRVADVNASSLSDFRNAVVFSPARIAQIPLVGVTGQARVAATNASATPLTFNYRDLTNGTIKSVSTTNLAQSLVGSLLENLTLNISVAGLGIGVPSNLSSTVANLLKAAATPIDTVLFSVLGALGVKVGEADVKLRGASCGRSVLVQ